MSGETREKPVGEGPAEAAQQSITDNPSGTAREQQRLIEAAVSVQLSEQLAGVRDRVVEAFGREVVTEVLGFRGELTMVVEASRILDVLAFCRDDEDIRCELLADLHGVHWPGGVVHNRGQETTGWPTYEHEQEGRIELDYLVRSIARDHAFRLRVNLADDGARIASATALWAGANFLEREVYDMLGVVFDGHPDLRRILMPDEWDGHPHRKDYPLGGVEVQYHDATIPPPDQRSY